MAAAGSPAGSPAAAARHPAPQPAARGGHLAVRIDAHAVRPAGHGAVAREQQLQLQLHVASDRLHLAPAPSQNHRHLQPARIHHHALLCRFLRTPSPSLPPQPDAEAVRAREWRYCVTAVLRYCGTAVLRYCERRAPTPRPMHEPAQAPLQAYIDSCIGFDVGALRMSFGA
eukprot:358102-Chlamydomonas_euryale.AAC.1